MAYDETLASRLRTILQTQQGVSERQAFGGISFLINGNMSVGVIGDELVVRVGPEGFETALADEHIRPFDFSGRPMKGWVYVAPEALASDESLAAWAQRGVMFARSLPSK
jgi:TfoX/Sxy family transcriptional regulator of competence genes